MNDLEATLPTEVEARESAVNDALFDRASRFLSTHTVELSMPEEVSRSLDEGKLILISIINPKKKKLFKNEFKFYKFIFFFFYSSW